MIQRSSNSTAVRRRRGRSTAADASGALLAVLCCALCCAAASPPAPQQCRGASGAGTILDITVPVRAGMPAWGSGSGLMRFWRSLGESIEEGDVVNKSFLNMDAHTGTHIDAPYHFLADGDTIENLPLTALIGAADLIEISGDTNVTAEVLKAVGIPQDAERLLFRTQNTRRKLMGKREFVTDFVGLDSTAARWLAAERPGVKLVGIDYLTIGMMDDIIETHKTLFRTGTVVVEGLNLTSVPEGRHYLTCLPLRLVGSDGSPARCVLQQLR